ncbi:hypothetical protein PUN28_017423 [Cardiocondyla obscurior]|uniref:Uncharacterized protein n=1 Tax=Cardiocondyla obscurior TaxID=286306 RepID=A0AAW2EPF9_9HYME
MVNTIIGYRVITCSLRKRESFSTRNSRRLTRARTGKKEGARRHFCAREQHVARGRTRCDAVSFRKLPRKTERHEIEVGSRRRISLTKVSLNIRPSFSFFPIKMRIHLANEQQTLHKRDRRTLYLNLIYYATSCTYDEKLLYK